MSSVRIQWKGQDREISAREGTSLLEVLRQAGIPVSAPCGGTGKCGKCRVILTVRGRTETVLACRTSVPGDCCIRVPELSDGMTEAAPVTRLRSGQERCGAAVDLGTTTVALRLVSLRDAAVLGTAQEWNAQMAYGADVISRVQYTMAHPEGLERLCGLIRGQIRAMLEDLCRRCGTDLAHVERLSLAGNTIMQHIFLEIPPESIAVAPYRPETLFDGDRPVRIPELPETDIFLAPCVSGYVGGDITAGLLAAGLDRQPGPGLFLDIGTNGEMALGGRAGLLCCSVASGPAFEGAEITCGMLSGPGAIQHVSWEQGRFRLEVPGGGQPRGLCGSGLIDLLAELLRLGTVDETGRLLPPEEAPEPMGSFLEEDEQGNGIVYLTEDHSVCFTAGDVRKLQLAKAAVAAGIQVLLDAAHITPEQVETLYIAGGFGGSLRRESAVAIGLIPGGLRTVFLGNSALDGAEQTLRRPELRAALLRLQRNCRYLELSGSQAFTEAFVDAMMFEA